MDLVKALFLIILFSFRFESSINFVFSLKLFLFSSFFGTLISISAAAASGGISLAGEAAIGAGIGATALQTVEALGGNGGGSGGLGGGSTQGLDKVVHVFVIQKDLTDTQEHFNPIIGKPYMGVATIGSFSGFVQTDGFQFEDAGALSSEKDMINRLLDTGIYYE